MTQIIERTPHVIAAEIRSIDTQTREIVLRSAIEIGKRLHEAKALVPHGEWGAWLEANVHYSQSTANNFMRIAEEYGSNFQAIENLSYTKALALLGVPAEEREQFAAEIGAEKLSARELQEAVKEKKRLEKELKESQKAAERERKEREALESRIAQLQTELADAKIAGNVEEAQKLQDALAEAQKRVKQLEAELKTRPIDVPAVVEKIPEEVERELAELRKKAAQPGNESAIKFKVQFEQLVAGFRDLLATLAEIQATDPETHEKYKGAVRGLIGKMQERL
jgi:DNA repair exonuclease SbcCD ATPase subunit